MKKQQAKQEETGVNTGEDKDTPEEEEEDDEPSPAFRHGLPRYWWEWCCPIARTYQLVVSDADYPDHISSNCYFRRPSFCIWYRVTDLRDVYTVVAKRNRCTACHANYCNGLCCQRCSPYQGHIHIKTVYDEDIVGVDNVDEIFGAMERVVDMRKALNRALQAAWHANLTAAI